LATSSGVTRDKVLQLQRAHPLVDIYYEAVGPDVSMPPLSARSFYRPDSLATQHGEKTQ
jgi:hypothetical protein